MKVIESTFMPNKKKINWKFTKNIADEKLSKLQINIHDPEWYYLKIKYQGLINMIR